MKILTISDEECPALWDYYIPGRLDEYDLIIACGDLNAKYLSFLVTMAKVPVLYVHGNHDCSFDRNPPEGCDCIEDKLVTYNGLRILGLGGCRQYYPAPHQYTEEKMRKRIHKLNREIKKAGGVDIVLTHAPARGLGDGSDPAHMGFEALRELLEQYHPTYLIHGHVHLNYEHNAKRIHTLGDTTIINAFERYALDVPDREYPPEQKNLLLWKGKNLYKD